MTHILEVDRIQVILKGEGPDKIIFDINRPSPFPDSVDDGLLSLMTSATRGTAVEYVKKTFGREPDEVIDAR